MAMETTREKRNILFCQFLFVFLRDHFRKRFSKFSSLKFFVRKLSNRTNLVKKRDEPNFSSHRIVQSTEIFDSPNYLVHWIIRLSESIDSPILFLMHRVWKPRKSMVITSLVWMVSQNLLKRDFILTMEHNKFYWMASHWHVTIWKVRDLRTDQYMKKSSYIFPIDLNIEIFPFKTGHRPLIRTRPWSPF